MVKWGDPIRGVFSRRKGGQERPVDLSLIPGEDGGPLTKEECWAWTQQHMPQIDRERFEACWEEAGILEAQQIVFDANRRVIGGGWS